MRAEKGKGHSRKNKRMPYSDYLRRRILIHHLKGLTAAAIADALSDEGLRATRQGITKFLRRVEETGSLERQPGSGRPSRLTPQMLALVEAQMRRDDETTVEQLVALLRHNGYKVFSSTVLRSRSSLGWTFRGSAYCQMIREANKAKWLHFAREYLHEAEDGFCDVVYTDETSIQLESHRRFCCRKRGEQPRPKPKYVSMLCADLLMHIPWSYYITNSRPIVIIHT